MKQTIDLLASDFDVDLTQSYSLSIRQQSDGYSFCVTDDNGKRCIAIKQIKAVKYPHQLSDEPLLQLNYQNVLFYGSGAYAIVPKSFIVNDNYNVFLPIEKNLKRRATTIVSSVNNESYIISHTNQWILPTIHLEAHHEIEPLIAYALNQTATTALYSEITTDKINIVVIKDQKFLLANSYAISTANDASYYILACYQQLQLSQENTPLKIMGNLLNINPTEFLKDYIQNIEIIKPVYWNSEFNNDIASFFTLQTLSNLICE